MEQDSPPAREHKAVTAFHGGKGGVGVTTLVAECATALSVAGFNVAAVDLDLYRGDLHFRLDVPVAAATHTVIDLLPVAGELDRGVADNALTRCRDGAGLLPAPRDGSGAAAADAASVAALIAGLAPLFDHVLLDTGCRYDAPVAAALSVADRLVLVVTPEIASVGGARRALDASRGHGGLPTGG